MKPTPGFSLLELLVVSALLALLAALVVPDSRPLGHEKVQVAANQIAAALRYARDTAGNTGTPHEVVFEADGRVAVQALDISSLPPAVVAAARHPVSRQPYTFNAESQPQTLGVNYADTASFSYAVGMRTSVTFDADGFPKFIDASGHHLLNSGSVTVSYAVNNVAVVVDGGTGRIHLQ